MRLLDVQEHIAGRASWHQRRAAPIRAQERRQVRQLAVEVARGGRIDLNLPVIGGQEDERLAVALQIGEEDAL